MSDHWDEILVTIVILFAIGSCTALVKNGQDSDEKLIQEGFIECQQYGTTATVWKKECK